MPTFPTYDGELPKCLNPLNPRHYLLVLYWVFFRPTALKCYLYQASPEIYRAQHSWSLLVKTRNAFYLLIMSIVLPIAASYLFFLLSRNNQSSTSNLFFVVWMLICLVIGFLRGISTNSISGVISALIAFGVWGGLVIGFSEVSPAGSWTWSHVEVIFLVTMFGTVENVIRGGYFRKPIKNWIYYVLNTAWMYYLLALVLLSSSGDFENSHYDFLHFCLLGLIFLLGYFRFPFYCLECIFVALVSKDEFHPILWDEIIFFPVPKTCYCLLLKLVENPKNGLSILAGIIGNPFQAWAAQSSICQYFSQSNSPLEDLYNWALVEELERYACIPETSGEWVLNISARQMILAELTDIYLARDGQILSGFCILPIALTKKLRLDVGRSVQGVLLQFLAASGLRQLNNSVLFDSVIGDSKQFISTSCNDSYAREVKDSINVIDSYSRFQTIEDLLLAPEYITDLPHVSKCLRPGVVRTLEKLSLISQETLRATNSSSRFNKFEGFARANYSLQLLAGEVGVQIPIGYFERRMLLNVITLWQEIITQAGGELSQVALLESVHNPYVAGPPVTGQLFVGREDILQTLEELWTKPGQLESVVIYGHRRMGKTSILRNLPGRFGPTTRIVNFNMQSNSGLTTTADLIHTLALTLYDDLPDHIQTHIPEPQPTEFTNPTTAFIRFLKKIAPHRQDDRFIIAIDEFELIEQGIENGYFDPDIIGHWRGILTDFPWIIFAFAGLHTLQEMTQDYWNPIFGSVRKVPVTFLSQAAATRLITNPSDDFPIDYEQDTIAQIYHLTGGQPYLIQLICGSLIRRFNRIRFEENQEIEPRFTEADLQAIVTHPDFFRDGLAYFRAIWEQAQETQGPAQLAILKQLATAPATTEQLQQTLNLPPNDFTAALNLLLEHDVIQPNTQGQYTYRVELMRQWVATQPR